jgi:hypothetical protein
MTELFIKVLAIVVAVILINWMFWHLVGLFTLIAGLLAPIIVLGLIVYLAFRYYQWRTARFDKRTAYKLWNQTGKAVYLFHAEPNGDDIAKIRDELSLASLELSGDVFGVENDTEVFVLEDEGSDAVRVRIVDAQAKEKVGWVPREAVIRGRKELSY